MPSVRVEFYGLARLRAGSAAASVTAATVGEALAAACPGLPALRENTISPEYLVSLNGSRFITDSAQALADGDTLLVLGVDAGG